MSVAIANCVQVVVLFALSGKNCVCSFGFLSDHCALAYQDEDWENNVLILVDLVVSE